MNYYFFPLFFLVFFCIIRLIFTDRLDKNLLVNRVEIKKQVKYLFFYFLISVSYFGVGWFLINLSV